MLQAEEKKKKKIIYTSEHSGGVRICSEGLEQVLS